MREISVRELMTAKVYTTAPEATVSEVAKLLAAHDISALPVCDINGHILGMISEGDLLRPFTEAGDARRAGWLSLLAEGNALAPAFVDFIKRENWPISQLMTHAVVTATESMTLPALSELLTTHRIKRVPVVRDGTIIGIVSRGDIIRAIR